MSVGFTDHWTERPQTLFSVLFNLTTMNLLYKGPSVIDNGPIIALLTGLGKPSTNAKTGPMLQTWILREDMPPKEALKGADHSICGDCTLKKDICYVNVHFAPRAHYQNYIEGRYKIQSLKKIGRNQRIRLGSYGDPAAVPIQIWDDLLMYADGWTGYTHSPHIQPDLKKYVQASCEATEPASRLRVEGWKTYRIKAENDPLMDGEVLCPSGRGVKCISCLMCNGQTKNIVIDVHGTKAKLNAYQRVHVP